MAPRIRNTVRIYDSRMAPRMEFGVGKLYKTITTLLGFIASSQNNKQIQEDIATEFLLHCTRHVCLHSNFRLLHPPAEILLQQSKLANQAAKGFGMAAWPKR